MNLASLDISAKTLTLAIRKPGKTHKPRDFENDPTAHAALIQALRQAKVTRVCLEATGVYPLDVAVALRAFGRYLAGLAKQPSPLKHQLHAWQQANATPDAIVKAMSGPIQDLDIQIEWLRAQALPLILRHSVLYQPYELRVSVKGIARASALPGELLVLRRARQWVAMAGLDPRHHQSGGSVNKKPRIS